MSLPAFPITHPPPRMHTPQSYLRLQKTREKYLRNLRQRRFDETLFIPIETSQLWLCISDRKTCHLTALKNVEVMSGLSKDDKVKDENTITWFIYHKDNPEEQIGSISLFQFSTLDAKVASAMLAYTLSPDHRGHGYMSESLGAILRFAFEKLGLETIEARVRTSNDRSKGVVQRAAFKNVGTVRKGKWGIGETKGIEIVELEIWILTKDEWEMHLAGSLSTVNTANL